MNQPESLGELHGRLLYYLLKWCQLLIVFACYVAALLHVLYIFLLPEDYVAMHGGDPEAARAVSMFAVVFFYGAAELLSHVWFQRPAVPAPAQ